MTKIGLTILACAISILCFVASALAQSKIRVSEQTHFSAEDERVANPVKVPDNALAILREDAQVKGALDDAQLTATQLPQSWFSTSVIHLHNSIERDLFVEAEGPLVGANIRQFWIFADTPGGMKLVANGAAHDVTIHRVRWRGYRIIELDSMTCCRLDTTWLRLENGKYRDYRHHSRKL